MFLQLACGVKHLHACGVLHRDLKADNALIASLQPLVVKWADFGVSVKLDVDSTYCPRLCHLFAQQHNITTAQQHNITTINRFVCRRGDDGATKRRSDTQATGRV